MATPDETPKSRIMDVLRAERPDLIPVLESKLNESREDSSLVTMTKEEFLAKYLPDS